MSQFVDVERPVSKKLEKILTEDKNDITKLISDLKKLIEEDPYYLETYIKLSEIMENEGYIKEAEEIILQAYERAMELLKGERGELPESVPWEYETNRHIIRAILETGITLWEVGEIDEALKVLKMLYKLVPGDPIGIRYYMLAILEGMGFEEFELTFGKNGGYDTKSLEEWFERHKEKFTEFLED